MWESRASLYENPFRRRAHLVAGPVVHRTPVGLTFALLVLTACTPPTRQAEIRFPSYSISVAGTIVLPADSWRHPGVIIIHGSGAQDRTPYPPLAREVASAHLPGG